MRLSVVVPAHNPAPRELERLYRALLDQTMPDFEVLVVDDGSTRADYRLLRDPRFRVIRLERNQGPGLARNHGVALARCERIYFTDADCAPAPGTLERVVASLECEDLVAGDTITRARSFFGRSVACLGLPGGGAVGFHNVWKVDEQGYALSLSTCNLGLTRRAFLLVGGFDATLPVPSGEDTLFAQKALSLGLRIKYDPAQVVWHAERSTWEAFMAWQINRGRGGFHLVRRLGLLRLLASCRPQVLGQVLYRAGLRHGPLVLFLMLASLVLLLLGYLRERGMPQTSQA